MGAAGAAFPGYRDSLWITSMWGLRFEKEILRVVTSAQVEVDAAQAELEVVIRRLEGTVQSPRIFKSGLVGADRAVMGPARDAIPVGMGATLASLTLSTTLGRHGPPYSLSVDEAKEFQAFQSTSVRAREAVPALDAAVRGFGYATDKQRPDDQLTDLVIAAEATAERRTTGARPSPKPANVSPERHAAGAAADGASSRPRIRNSLT
jgi:hypothetical protein